MTLRTQQALRFALLGIVGFRLAGAADCDKLQIQSPASGAKFATDRVIVSACVPPGIRRVETLVTVPDNSGKTPSDAQSGAKTQTGATGVGGSGPAAQVVAANPLETAASQKKSDQAPKTTTVFAGDAEELARGAQIWSTEVLLAKGDNLITVRDADNTGMSTSVTVNSTAEQTVSDTRESFEASFYVGMSIDSFASSELKNYYGYASDSAGKANLQQASGPQLGYIAGIDFAKRLTKRRSPVQLWLYGETVHGQRSTEVDCKAASPSPVCSGFNPANAADGFLAILRNSTSLEAYAGLRLEFWRLNPADSNSVSLYAKSQLGFMTVQSNGGNLVDDHIKAALGAIMTNGAFRDSYFECGWGRTDLFAIHRGRRLKVDGYVQWKVSDKVPFYPFFQMTVDSDLGPGSDSVRSYYGINMDIRTLTSLFQAKKTPAAGTTNPTNPGK
jgi:hypothetical protein